MKRPLLYVLAASNHGPMIVNRNDWDIPEKIETWHSPGPSGDYKYGIGHNILEEAEFEMDEINLIKHILSDLHNKHNRPIVVIDGGANIGTHTIEMAKHMTDWGSVISFEVQERVFYALAGNIVLNNCYNVQAQQLGLSDQLGVIYAPVSTVYETRNHGSYSCLDEAEITIPTMMVTIDDLHLNNLDFLKLDIEGMELMALNGGKDTIQKYKPIIMLEYIHIEWAKLLDWCVENNYMISDKSQTTIILLPRE